MLADPSIDAIDICTPTHTHLDLVLAALAAGKHVICEKPMARTSAEARQMVDAAAKAGRILMPAMCLRFWPEWAWLKEGGVERSLRQGLVRTLHPHRLSHPAGAPENVSGWRKIRRCVA